MIRSAVLLAAGEGTRLRPLTDNIPKPLLPLAYTTLLGHNLEHLAEAGIHRILTVIPPDTQAAFEAYSQQYPDLELTFIEQRRPLGTGHAVGLARNWMNGQPFFMCYGDNVTNYDFRQLVVAYLQNGDACTLALRRVADPTQHGVVELDGTNIRRIVEKPKDPPTDLTFAGMCILPPRIFEAIKQTPHSRDGEYYLPDAIQLLINTGEQVGFDQLNVWRLNVNRPRELMEAHRQLFRYSEVHVSMQESHRIQHPVALSDDAVIGKCYRIGPDVTITEGCTIGNDCMLKQCILLPGAGIGDGCVLSNVIVASGTKIPEGMVCEAEDEPAILA